MPAGIPKVGKMPDWVKKRIEARKKAEAYNRRVRAYNDYLAQNCGGR